ncbi:MAG: TetR/AcrR family transcriptional regulator [Lacisediminihabitans sp.]
MSDPRIQRTRDHVLSTVRRLLAEPASAPLTFTILAAEAQVSRRTLYTHWGSIDRAISDAVTGSFAGEVGEFDGLSTFESLHRYLIRVRDGMMDPVFAATATMQIAKATRDPEAAASLRETNQAAIDEFAERVAPVTAEQYGAIVGPVFFAQLIARSPMTDDALREHAESVALALGLAEPAL